MSLIHLVAALALAQYLLFGALVGKARGQYGVKAPAVTGHEGFERMYRVQMNTLELSVLFLPTLYIAARYWPAGAVAGLGAVYVVGRQIYRQAYVRDPASRGLGFVVSIVPIALLLVGGAVGALRQLA